MNWYQIVRLVLAVLKILDFLPKDKKQEAEIQAFEAIAQVVSENNIA